MAEHAGFLADILEHPDDDTPRLVFADWLDDQGHADRAEFIRLQVEAARLGEDDPRAVDLDSRAEAILAECEHDWLGEWSERLVRWAFRRGFLDEITIEAEPFLRDGVELFARFPVRRVRFVGADGNCAGPEAAPALCMSKAFPRIRSLDASGCLGDLWSFDFRMFSSVTGLRELSLADDSHDGSGAISEAALSPLVHTDNLRDLESLDISTSHGNGISDQAIDLLASSVFASRLRSLILNGQDISATGVQRLTLDGTFASLQRLDLGGCPRMTREANQLLLDSPHLDQLESLSLSGDIDLARLASSPRLGQLHRLMLAGSSVPAAASWAAFARSPYLDRLRYLGLSFRSLDADMLAELLAAPGLRNLKTFAVWGTHAGGDAVLASLASAFPHRLQLTTLDLINCGVSSPGISALASSPCLSGLAQLRLAWNEVWPAITEELLASSYLSPRLKRLDLSGWDLSRSGCAVLAGNPRLSGLKHLTLRSTGIDAEGMASLLASPHLRRLTALHLGSERSAEALLLLAHSSGLPRLRELVLGSRADAGAIEALRQRFGARLIVYQDE